MTTRLLASLTKALGASQARQEFKWMQQAANASATAPSLDEMVRRRSLGEPLQYILGAIILDRDAFNLTIFFLLTGTQPFGPLNLLTRAPTLIPRPETEHWVLKLAEMVSPTAASPISLLDLGTGTGCIPLLLCHLWPAGSVRAHAVDISSDALRLASENAALCGIPSASEDQSKPTNTFATTLASFLSNDFPSGAELEQALPIDVLTSNPPYISWQEYLELEASVTNHEDSKALFGGPDGLDFYHAIVRLICRRDLFKPHALVALEVGHQQAESVQALLRSSGRITRSDIWTDPWGKKRTVVARM